MASSMNRRQARHYTDRVHLYRPLETLVGDDQAAEDLAYPQLPTYRDIGCYHVESQEENVASVIGRSDYDIMATTDQFKFAAGQDIGDGWLIRIVRKGDQDVNQFYVVQGDAQDKPAVHRRRASQRKLYAKKTVKPMNIEL